ncbi:MAG: hypothetical protein IPO21_20360 [Bacteroidales bacterium]|nr:hypothetical protein [Bacteroidales bacterium]
MLPDEMNRELAKVATFCIHIFNYFNCWNFYNLLLYEFWIYIKRCTFESSSTLGTVGLSCGITNPEMSPVLEVTYIIQMWAEQVGNYSNSYFCSEQFS